MLNRFISGVVEQFYVLVNIGLFLVILTTMLFVEVKEIGRAFTKVKPTALALATNFIFTPFFRMIPRLVIFAQLPRLVGWSGAL